ncbi:hypothetical protein ANN_09540 [Periplaneta americana]|uniref:Transposable element P transposase-like RNase H domain-containing protein n=1 Tax=Periplaneta americana TaxID=6978 RepID=A0ABQ8TML0_PERAM|nr:hypothetical protein ANN_09540 [Periplaneta americana]
MERSRQPLHTCDPGGPPGQKGTRSLIGLQAATEQAAGLGSYTSNNSCSYEYSASKITASTAYAGMNKDACQQGPGVAKRKLFSSPHFSSSPQEQQTKNSSSESKGEETGEKNCNKSKKTEFRIKLEGEGANGHIISTANNCSKDIQGTGPLSDRSENVCPLIIDEIAIRQQLHYDSKSDMIKGFADDVIARYPMKIGNHCLMAMVKGIKKGWKQGMIIDPTIRFETYEGQPEDVHEEKRAIYVPNIPYYKDTRKYQLHDISITGLMFGARGTIPNFSSQFCKTLGLHKSFLNELALLIIRESTVRVSVMDSKVASRLGAVVATVLGSVVAEVMVYVHTERAACMLDPKSL